MSVACRFAYVQARVQARYSRLPGDEEWQRLAAARGLAGFLEEARAGALGNWIKPFSGQSDCHDLEVGLRALYREQVGELAGWLPGPWREAMAWTRWLVLLPLFDHVARGGDMPPWVGRDHDLAPLLGEDGRLDPQRLRHGAAALLAPGGDPAAAWLVHWHLLWPPCKRDFLANLRALEDLLGTHLDTFRRAGPDAAWGVRSALRTRLRLLFHRRLLQPAGPFVYLVLVALDLERLRAELTVRALFPAAEAA